MNIYIDCIWYFCGWKLIKGYFHKICNFLFSLFLSLSPYITSPAPWNTNTLFFSGFLVIFRLARIPATATAAVPAENNIELRPPNQTHCNFNAEHTYIYIWKYIGFFSCLNNHVYKA